MNTDDQLATPPRHLESEADELIKEFYPQEAVEPTPDSPAPELPTSGTEAPQPIPVSHQPSSGVPQSAASVRAQSRLSTSSTKEAVSPKLVAIVIGIIMIPTLLIGGWGIFGRGSTQKSPTVGLVPTSLPESFLRPSQTPTAHVLDLSEDESSPTPTPKASSTPSPRASASPSPSSLPSPSANTGVDLAVEDLQVEDPQTGTILSSPFYAGQRVTVRAKLKNIGTVDSGIFSSAWSIKGTTMGSNSNGKLKAGATALYDDVNSITAPIFFLSQDSNSVTYTVDTANVLTEANRTNNAKTITITAGATRSDLEAVSISYYEQGTTTAVTSPSVGQKLTVRATIKNNGQDKQTNFSLKWSVNDSQVKETTVGSWINPSNSLEETSGYDFTVASGTTNIKAEINTTSAFPETNTANNSKTVTLSL